MQRTRPVRVSLIAIPLTDSKKAKPPTPKAIRQAIRKAPEAKPDHAAYAVKALRNIMAYGTETGKIAAARLLLQSKYSQVGDRPATPHVPVIQYIVSGEPPPLGEGEYDTRDKPTDPTPEGFAARHPGTQIIRLG